MATPFIAQITLFAGNFAPRGWAFCSGQIMSIAQNTALFSLVGVTYGGNGQTTFALPDLRGRVPIHVGGNSGQGPGLSPYTLGQQSGTETVTLTTTQMPAHNHVAQVTSNASSGAATDTLPNGNFLASDNQYTNAANAVMNANAVTVAIGVAGGSQPHDNRQPSLGINFIIAMEGIFPSRN